MTHTMLRTMAIGLMAAALSLPSAAQRPEHRPRPRFDAAYPSVHDPVMAFENGRYYLFMTGFGIGVLSSADLHTWQQERPVMSEPPAWATELVPGYRGHTWAPDIQRVGDRWYLYYSCSTFGKNRSAIGVMTNCTLDPKSADYHWEDLGLVIKSVPRQTDWNAIDPNLIIDEDGHPWLCFGSFWDGIQLVRLAADMHTTIGKPVTIARRRNPEAVEHNTVDANLNAIEAPFIIHHGDYYYLFVSYDFCCKGLNSDYKTAVGRSKTVSGPYLDKEGKRMDLSGGTIIAEENDRYVGIGHSAAYEFGGQWYFLAHGYDRTLNGASKLFIRRIEWHDGWPGLTDE